jgi:lipid II:glycine glycyltransferase (peptidoglycan interpeptide bridge formation enzyme)
MKVSIVKNKQNFNNFVSSQQFSQFLQSYDWAEFQEKSGNQVLPLAVFDDSGKITASALLIKRKVPFSNKNYWYCPRGPIIKNNTPYGEYYSLLLQYINRIAGKEKIIFTRWEPAVSLPDKGYKTIKTIDIQPSRTIMLDLSFSKEDLLRNMHQKTRYNTRLAFKKGVEVREAEEREFDEFWDLMEATAERDDFRLHSRQHYKKMLQAAPHIFRLFLAKYKDKTIAGNIVSFFGDTVTYVHGASDHEYRKFMAPYALQWEVISLAKEQGFQYYDLYGIDDNKWPGVTRFKRGFGGEEIQYPGTYDVVFDKKRYWVYKIARSVRRRI